MKVMVQRASARKAAEPDQTMQSAHPTGAQAERLNHRSAVTQARRIAVQLNARNISRTDMAQRMAVVQRSDDESMEESSEANVQPAPPSSENEPQSTEADSQAEQMQDNEASAEQEEDPYADFTFENIVFSSRGEEATHAAQRSIYFANGRRIRLEHDHGPEVSETQMDRFTFKQGKDKDDYKQAVKDETDPIGEGILKPAEVGDTGKLFEVQQGRVGKRGRTHPSRGVPTQEQGIQDQEHLNRVLTVARQADVALQPFREKYKRARARVDRSDGAIGKKRLSRAKRALKQAAAEYNAQMRDAYAPVQQPSTLPNDSTNINAVSN
jgi:hypothetical protein